MRIVIFTQTFPLNPEDSTAHFMYDFCLGFAKLGNDVTVLLPFCRGLDPQSFKGIKVVSFKYIWPLSLHVLGFGKTLKNDNRMAWYVYFLAPFFYFFGVIMLYKTVSKGKVDIINAHWVIPSGFIVAIVSKLTSIPLAITIPGSDAFIAKQNIFFGTMAKFALAQATYIISNSPALLEDLGVDGKIISYPVEVNEIVRTRSRELRVATAGRRVEKKGFEKLAKIYPNIEIISNLPIDEFRKKLLSVDVLIVPSIRDSRGNLDDASVVILEGMAAGCAVIATNLPGNRLIIKDGVNGLLIDPHDLGTVRAAIFRLKRSSAMRTRLGLAAKETIKQRFLPKKIASLYLAVYSNKTHGK